jgi:hypothetical protein
VGKGRRAVALAVAGALVGPGLLLAPAEASRPPIVAAQCAQQGISGPDTDVNAQAGDGRITVGSNEAGTITVFKYPNPSYYNQVKYYTSDRDASGGPTGALANEGSFAGIRYVVGGTPRFAWLRVWPHTQSYASVTTPVPVTVYQDAALGLTVYDTDLATVAPTDAYVRDFTVRRSSGSPVQSASLVYYEKFSPIASKLRYAAGQDNCLQQANDQQLAAYDTADQAIIHSWVGVDASTGQPSSVAVAFGFDSPATAHEVGRDAFDPAALPVGPADGYRELEAQPYTLGGASSEDGQATGAIETPLQFAPNGVAGTRMIIAPATTAAASLAALHEERARSLSVQLAAVDHDWSSWLSTAALPATTDGAVRAVAVRALITMRLAVDPDSGAIVASADTQAPYGEDWIRDGAFIDEALDVAGYHSMVTRHDLFEAAAQTSLTNPDALRPPGNWPMMVYGDGLPGGPIPYEIDETGFGAWTLYDHARFLPPAQSRAYLAQVFPAISRAADWLAACQDPTTGLPCEANEDDSFTPSQTLHGAGPVLLGLRSAIEAAAALEDSSPAVALWKQRAAALQSAIDALYDPAQHAYREQAGASSALPVLFTDGGWLLWPVQLHPGTDARMVGEASAVWSSMLASLSSPSGGYEGKALLGVCETWRPATPAQSGSMQAVLHEFATQLTTNTGLFGEWWQRFPPNNRIRPLNDIPHVWESALFYLSSVCIDG